MTNKKSIKTITVRRNDSVGLSTFLGYTNDPISIKLNFGELQRDVICITVSACCVVNNFSMGETCLRFASPTNLRKRSLLLGGVKFWMPGAYRFLVTLNEHDTYTARIVLPENPSEEVTVTLVTEQESLLPDPECGLPQEYRPSLAELMDKLRLMFALSGTALTLTAYKQMAGLVYQHKLHLPENKEKISATLYPFIGDAEDLQWLLDRICVLYFSQLRTIPREEW